MDILKFGGATRTRQSSASDNMPGTEETPRSPLLEGTFRKRGAGIASSLLALGFIGIAAASQPTDNSITIASQQVIAASAPSYSAEAPKTLVESVQTTVFSEEITDLMRDGSQKKISAKQNDDPSTTSELTPYTFTRAVEASPFPLASQIEAAEQIEYEASDKNNAGNKKHSYLPSEEVKAAAADQEIQEEKEAKLEGATAIKVTGASTTVVTPIEDSKEAARTEAKATKENENNESPSLVKNNDTVVKGGSSKKATNVADRKTKITVSGTLKECLDAAAAEKKDQNAKAAKREEERKEAEYQAYLNSEQGMRDRVVAAAYSRLGVPYVWGGTDPDYGMDCSGFTQWCYSTIGIATTRTTETQYAAALERVPVGEAKPGDILYSGGHVGLYVGDGAYIHEPSSGDVCRVAYDLGQFSTALRFL